MTKNSIDVSAWYNDSTHHFGALKISKWFDVQRFDVDSDHLHFELIVDVEIHGDLRIWSNG